MTNEELQAHVEVLEAHVSKLEGIIRVMLEEIADGTIQDSTNDSVTP